MAKQTKHYPCCVMYRTATGMRTTKSGYGLIKRMRDENRLLGAWCTSTGKILA